MSRRHTASSSFFNSDESRTPILSAHVVALVLSTPLALITLLIDPKHRSQLGFGATGSILTGLYTQLERFSRGGMLLKTLQILQSHHVKSLEFQSKTLTISTDSDSDVETKTEELSISIPDHLKTFTHEEKTHASIFLNEYFAVDDFDQSSLTPKLVAQKLSDLYEELHRVSFKKYNQLVIYIFTTILKNHTDVMINIVSTNPAIKNLLDLIPQALVGLTITRENAQTLANASSKNAKLRDKPDSAEDPREQFAKILNALLQQAGDILFPQKTTTIEKTIFDGLNAIWKDYGASEPLFQLVQLAKKTRMSQQPAEERKEEDPEDPEDPDQFLKVLERFSTAFFPNGHADCTRHSPETTRTKQGQASETLTLEEPKAHTAPTPLDSDPLETYITRRKSLAGATESDDSYTPRHKNKRWGCFFLGLYNAQQKINAANTLKRYLSAINEDNFNLLRREIAVLKQGTLALAVKQKILDAGLIDNTNNQFDTLKPSRLIHQWMQNERRKLTNSHSCD
jgi:hypothetical protein